MDLSKYTTSQTAWSGIYQYASEHPDLFGGRLPNPLSEDGLLKMIKKQGAEVLSPKEYDTFRKSVTSVRKGKIRYMTRENLYRLFFVMGLDSDTRAQDLLMNYLHQSELSARSLDEFIVIAALKIGLTWEETRAARLRYAERIAAQPVSPSGISEGQTAEVYYKVIHDRIRSLRDLYDYLDADENLDFFARTCNTQYLALFSDVELEVIYNAGPEEKIRLYSDFGSLERETMRDYYDSLFGMTGNAGPGGKAGSGDGLSEAEILSLAGLFDNVFMSYDNFCLLVQRKRPVNVSSGTFLLGLFGKLLTEDEDSSEDFYVNFLDPEEFTGVINDILVYFGFPVLSPELDPFESLVMDTYTECLAAHSGDRAAKISNSEFAQIFTDSLRENLRLLARREG